MAGPILAAVQPVIITNNSGEPLLYAVISGTIGFSGFSGFSGYSGVDGAPGDSGYSGIDGAPGDSGISGYSGIDGQTVLDYLIAQFSGESGALYFSGDALILLSGV